MLVKSNSRTSMLYDTISDLGLVCSEEKHIRMVREESNTDTYFHTLPLSNSDIDRVGYLNPHIETELKFKDKLEIWINDHYQHPDRTVIVEHDPFMYVVMDDQYDLDQKASVHYNPSIIYRYHAVAPDQAKTYTHRITIDTRNAPYNQLDRPDKAAYFISDNQIKIPTATWLNEYQVQFVASYQNDIDFFICSNLVGLYQADANVGLYIDSPDSPVCYHHIVIDGDPSYPIDARFYPCICVDKDCIVRVYNDSYHELKYPETCRLINYPEFSDIEDPYNPYDSEYGEYLRTLKEVDDVIYRSDSDAVIYKKFLRILRFCYRVWERFPIFSNEVSDFVICDNHRFDYQCFRTGKIAGMTESINAIYSTVPFESHRDLLFYDGYLFSDYKVMQLSTLQNDTIVESDITGQPRYVILIGETGYDLDKFSLIKFNSWEDTNIFNVGDYIDEKLTLQLNQKLNRFYRNLMVIRRQIMDQPGDEYVRIMTETPPKDEHLWFELLVNANPEQFSEDTDLVINLYGVDGHAIPESVAKGAYMLELEPEQGPANYTGVLMTYFDLEESNKKYLALQYQEGDKTIGVYHDLTIGNTDHVEGDGGLVIEDKDMKEPYKEGVLDIGDDDQPDGTGRVPGDLYVQVDSDVDLDELDSLIEGSSDGPQVGDLMLDDLMYTPEEDHITPDTISKYTRDQKLSWIKDHINTIDDEALLAQINEQLLDATDDTLDQIIYKLMQTEYIYETGKESGSSVQTLSDEDEVIQHNLNYIISEEEPTDVQINDVWIHLDDVDMSRYVKDVICYQLKEAAESIKNPIYDNSKIPIEASVAFEYGAHDESGTFGEIFQGSSDPTLRKVHVGSEQPTVDQLETDMDVWYEYLDEITDKVCYYDSETMIIRVDERLVAIQFAHDNLTGFLFDDIVLNFRGKLGIKYLSILADLMESGVIKDDQINVFYKRLITNRDHLDVGLKRLYTGTSHVVSTAKLDSTDLAVLYSSNIGRFRMDYTDDEMTNREREAAYRHCIDYSNRDFAYLTDRMLVFVNGKYIPRDQCREEIAQKLQILNFDEVISTVDIFYSMKDIELMQVKKSAYAYWPLADDSTSIQRPERDYEKMSAIMEYEQTKRGYYDILLDEFIFNGKLLRILSYLEEHPDEAERFKMEIVNQFHAISDLDLTVTGKDQDRPRIIIPGMGNNPIYTIKEA